MVDPTRIDRKIGRRLGPTQNDENSPNEIWIENYEPTDDITYSFIKKFLDQKISQLEIFFASDFFSSSSLISPTLQII